MTQELDYEFVYTYIEYPKGTPAETISQELVAAGFESVATHDFLENQHFLVFAVAADSVAAVEDRMERRPESSSAGSQREGAITDSAKPSR